MACVAVLCAYCLIEKKKVGDRADRWSSSRRILVSVTSVLSTPTFQMAPRVSRGRRNLLFRTKLNVLATQLLQLVMEILGLAQAVVFRLSIVCSTFLQICSNIIGLLSLVTLTLKGELASAELISRPTIYPRLGVAIEPDPELILFNRIEEIMIETVIPPPIISAHESCSRIILFLSHST